jgi:hypothetical protein
VVFLRAQATGTLAIGFFTARDHQDAATTSVDNRVPNAVTTSGDSCSQVHVHGEPVDALDLQHHMISKAGTGSVTFENPDDHGSRTDNPDDHNPGRRAPGPFEPQFEPTCHLRDVFCRVNPRIIIAERALGSPLRRHAASRNGDVPRVAGSGVAVAAGWILLAG